MNDESSKMDSIDCLFESGPTVGQIMDVYTK